MVMVVLQGLMHFLSYWYLQYTLVTAVYMLEPVERKIVNSVLVATIAIILYSGYVFLPGHTMMMRDFFDHIFSPEIVAAPKDGS